jgi:5-methylthioadenosine/S-adenosylhomocysteine deaminase
MRCTASVSKGINMDPTCVPAVEALRMATYEGARSLGFSRKGMIREGWVADLVLVDLNQPHMVGVNEENFVHFLVYAGACRDVLGTMVAGRWIYKDGVYPTVDFKDVMSAARAAREALLK